MGETRVRGRHRGTSRQTADHKAKKEQRHKYEQQAGEAKRQVQETNTGRARGCMQNTAATSGGQQRRGHHTGKGAAKHSSSRHTGRSRAGTRAGAQQGRGQGQRGRRQGGGKQSMAGQGRKQHNAVHKQGTQGRTWAAGRAADRSRTQ